MKKANIVEAEAAVLSLLGVLAPSLFGSAMIVWLYAGRSVAGRAHGIERKHAGDRRR